MSLDYLYDTPEVAFRSTIDELQTMNPKIHASMFETLTIDKIDNMLDDLYRRERTLVEDAAYGSWLVDPTYIQIKLLQEGLGKLREHREELEETEIVVPGFSYYRNVRQFGKMVEGQVCKYLGTDRPANWINFVDMLPVMKILEVLRHGDERDFRRIYVEIANGRADGLSNISVEHIAESTDDALLEMESYCNHRWEGPWPWEISSPFKMLRLVEERTKMRNHTLTEMHQLFQQLLEMNEDGGAEKFEIISYSRTLSEEIQNLIDKFAKIAGETIISFKSQVLTAMGDEAAMKVESSITAPINQAADALSRLKSNVDRLIIELEQHQDSGLEMGGPDMMGNGMDQGMGSPDIMGGNEGNMPSPEGEEDMEPPEGTGPMPQPTDIMPERAKKLK